MFYPTCASPHASRPPRSTHSSHPSRAMSRSVRGAPTPMMQGVGTTWEDANVPTTVAAPPPGSSRSNEPERPESTYSVPQSGSQVSQAGDLLPAVHALRDEVAATTLPLDLPGARTAVRERAELLNQLDDYIVPRLSSLDAPLLAVVGGSTGSGKSTIVNSLVGSTVSAPGVLRPTTRSPVLVHHPDDATWFADQRVLPGLARAERHGVVTAEVAAGSQTVTLVSATALPPGMALLDAPDIDSVVQDNRELARQLLGAADLWLFVTTAARYADAVPWELLRQASARGTSVAVILNRVPAGAVAVVREHLASMLKEQQLGAAPIFTVTETTLLGDGLLPPDEIGRLQSWLSALAKDARARAIVVRQTLTGALDSLAPRIQQLIDASSAQVGATGELAAGPGRRTTTPRPPSRTGCGTGLCCAERSWRAGRSSSARGSSSSRSRPSWHACATGSRRRCQAGRRPPSSSTMRCTPALPS